MGAFRLAFLVPVLRLIPTSGQDFCPEPTNVANPLGHECECDGQLFVGRDCSMAFYCVADGNDKFLGCLLECKENERVAFSPSVIGPFQGAWDCEPKAADNKCRGNFQLDCPSSNPDTFEIDCHCRDEYWQNQDCKEGFLCKTARGPGQVENVGQTISCDRDDEIIVNVVYYNDGSHTCLNEADQEAYCPGSFHYGCKEDGGAYRPSTGGAKTAIIDSLALAFTITFAFALME